MALAASQFRRRCRHVSGPVSDGLRVSAAAPFWHPHKLWMYEMFAAGDVHNGGGTWMTDWTRGQDGTEVDRWTQTEGSTLSPLRIFSELRSCNFKLRYCRLRCVVHASKVAIHCFAFDDARRALHSHDKTLTLPDDLRSPGFICSDPTRTERSASPLFSEA